MMKRSLLLLLTLTLGCLCSCESADSKKKKRPPLPGEEQTALPFNRPTRASEVGSPFGLPESR